ncbi:ABC transporter permease [Treponema pedis]|uniref:ABC transporter permease n=1 Tax=Treponema pedis TaxID=409322 RepID=UPI00042536E5|nr:ABC transporter permease [Treponema pedis]
MKPEIKYCFNFFIKCCIVFLGATLFAFGISRAMPTSPVQILLTSRQLPPTRENISFLEYEWGLDKSLPEQYLIWTSRLIKGDLGVSMLTKQPVKTEFIKRLPYSIGIGLGGLLLGAALSFYLGYKAALKERGCADFITRIFVIINQTVPVFILAVILIYFIGVKYKLLKIFTGNNGIKITSAMLLIMFGNMGSLSRNVKSHFKKVTEESYFIFAVSRGFTVKKALLNEGCKPALIGLISLTISKCAWVIGGSAVMEFIFTIPGISFFLIESIMRRDYNVIQAYIIVIAIWMFFVHFLLEFVLILLDRRQR